MLKTVFFGTPDLAATVLRALAGLADVVAVVTQPDKPKGRGRALSPPPVKLLAESLGIPALQPSSAKDAALLDELSRIAPDLILTAAYGKILPPSVLNLPKLGCFNAHASLLPKYRGAAPINRAIMDGGTETGITLMRMDEGMDTGNMLMVQRIAIGPDDNAGTLTEKLAALAASMLPEFLSALSEGRLVDTVQNHAEATSAHVIKKDDALIDWSISASGIRNFIRGLNPRPGAHTFLDGTQIRILAAQAVDGGGAPGEIVHVDKGSLLVGAVSGLLSITEIQPPGKSVMPVRAFLQGRRLAAGMRFSGASGS
ncbi:MAG: methionyl-tRNA formyltransferase [Nitrospirae bacterium]|nr:methionyl-tRNA formyltransferase [Nitrospirota bacterium]